jgi:hypothetical protein
LNNSCFQNGALGSVILGHHFEIYKIPSADFLPALHAYSLFVVYRVFASSFSVPFCAVMRHMQNCPATPTLYGIAIHATAFSLAALRISTAAPKATNARLML